MKVPPKWLKMITGVENIRAAVCDLNGVWRGKLMPASQAEKILVNGFRMPLSATSVDIWGVDLEDSPLVFETGDADGICTPTGRGVMPINWLSTPSLLMPLWMETEEGDPSPVCPRRILAHITNQLSALGYTAVVAVELEFYLLDPTSHRPLAPVSPISNRLVTESVLSVDDIDHFDGFFADVYTACATHGIPADAAISETGAAQFEINLKHVDDPLRAADDAVFFKRIIKGMARKHGMAASFMAKPYADQSGSGMHVHFSLLDKDGNNVFDNDTDEGSSLLLNAVAGLLDHMPASTLMLAPHLNSYRRLAPGTHAPSAISWGYENRTAAIRIPGGDTAARRIEHRVAGADANPYLVIAAILSGALHGLQNQLTPPDPVEGDAYEAGLPHLPEDWHDAIVAFENSAVNAQLYPEMFQKLFAMLKWQERSRFAARISDFEIATYMDTV